MVNVVKRAFEIAPECGSIEEVKRRLIREGFEQVNAHLMGAQIRRQIKHLINPDPTHRVPKRVRDYGQ
jgi:hypothetical protein